MNTTHKTLAVLAALLCAAKAHALTDEERLQQSRLTEVWEPEPTVVAAPAGGVPSDAVVLLDSSGASAWESVAGGDNPWLFDNGVMTVKPGAGDVRTRATFCDVQLHLEWKTPANVEGMEGQQRNNSGVFLQERYEVQILDSHDNRTYSNGQAAAIYKQHIPLVNASRPPGQWQSYDIVFRAPRFDGAALLAPANITVFHNGVLVQNQVEIQGTTVWIGPASYEAHDCAPLRLQDHGNSVSFRNIWVREL